MKKQIDTIKKVRTSLLEGIKDLTTEQLNRIPEGFNNNIIWNLGHLVAAQQGICYKRAGLKPLISEEFWGQYGPKSKPQQAVNEAEIENIKTLLLITLDELEMDYDKNVFTGYAAWTTSYGIGIADIDDALSFISFHEGLHSGTIMAMKRLVTA